MKKIKFIRLALAILLAVPTYAQVPQLGKNSVKEVIDAMTVEEKAKMLVGACGGPLRLKGSFAATAAIPRLGIPAMLMNGGPGLSFDVKQKQIDSTKLFYITAFPINTLLASSWDVELAELEGEAIGREALEYGIDFVLGPNINIHRHPLGGRNFEYYSEDPIITGYIAAAYTKGFQSNGVGVQMKHFAVNNQEFHRFTINELISERALREIYLRGSEIVVRTAAPWSIMSSYPRINNVYASENKDLLTTILRDEWGFKGFVATDWGAGSGNSVAYVNAGNNIIMQGSQNNVKAIVNGVNIYSIDMPTLDKNVEDILNIIVKTPAFRNQKTSYNPDLNYSQQIARKVASESMVLLKNDANTLPLPLNPLVALFGDASFRTLPQGIGSADSRNIPHVINISDGFRRANCKVEPQTFKFYNKYEPESFKIWCQITDYLKYAEKHDILISDTLIQEAANNAFVGIYTIARQSTEGRDEDEKVLFQLTANEQANIDNLSKAFHAKGKKFVVVLNIGNPIETVSWRDKVDAILLAYKPGQEGGDAVVDVLLGKVNPSGKLATTFPVNCNDSYSSKNFPGKVVPNGGYGDAEVVYEEGIYVGYRYFNSFGVKAAYEFGYGLSYTNFEYSNLQLSSTKFKDELRVSVTITNTGKVAGKEVVQLYLSAPGKKLKKPERELKAFAKTKLLQPNESQTITLTLNPKDLASFYTPSSAWIAEAGVYNVKIGISSTNIKLTKKFKLAKELLVEQCHKALALPREISELK
jgi:beta-glucosidase